MHTWFDVITPHEDIRKGNFDESVFAAKLGEVVSGDAPTDYSDPYAFYKRTYLTKGLNNVLSRVHKKLRGGGGAGIVQLQTPFGGGKTHALILVHHYLKQGERVTEFLPAEVEPVEARQAVIVGTDTNPATGFRSDGAPDRLTFWGELAYQLGGMEAFEKIRANDEARISPGKDDLQAILEPLQPFVIMMDEVVHYVGRASGIAVGDTTLATQTRSFFQELTEAVSSLPQGMLIATLPSSEIEDFGEQEERNLQQVQKAFGRLETIYTPVEGTEVFSIIRQRLFEGRPDEEKVRKIVDDYISTYNRHKNDVPSHVRSEEYRQRMELAYPFHPSVIEALYTKWGTYSSFQRTRGVLRLLAHVIKHWYDHERSLNLILPGDVNLDNPSIRREFIKHIGNTYDSIISSDIAGPDAKSQQMDTRNREWHHLAERNATTIFLNSFSVDRSKRGVDLDTIRMGVLRPTTEFSLVTEVLRRQEEELWYLNKENSRYYFSEVPNLNRMVVDRKSVIAARDVREMLQTQIEKQLTGGGRGAFKCIVWPNGTDDIPDNKQLTLVLLDPSNTPAEDELAAWSVKRTSGRRVYPNTIFYGVADEDRTTRLESEIREYIALKEIAEEITKEPNSQLKDQLADVKRRISKLKGDIAYGIREAYRRAYVPQAQDTLELVDFGKPSVGNEHLDTWYLESLSGSAVNKILRKSPSAALIKSKFLQNGNVISVEQVADQFARNRSLPALRNTSLLQEAIASGVQQRAFALAQGTPDDVQSDSLRFGEQISPSQVHIESGWVLLTEAKAEELIGEPEPAPEPTPSPTPEPGEPTPSPTQAEPDPDPEPTPATVRQLHLRVTDIPASKIADFNRGVLSPLTREHGAFTFTLELNLSSEDGISEQVINDEVLETLRQLGAKIEVDERTR